jgi:NADPH:quinone reductase-like Zn-dependent oxidoreductase
MKCLEASRFGGPDVLRVVEKETPQPGEGILLVENDYPYEDYAEGGDSSTR